MDNAVALVQAYLHVNGYFTVTEYPVIEAMKRGGYQTTTDLDILAFRFPGAGRLVPAKGKRNSDQKIVFEPDPKLGCPVEHADMLIGEVKEGRAELNRGARNPEVLRAALTRFGCCPASHVSQVVEELLRRGYAITHAGHRVRMVAFGSVTESASGRGYEIISLGHVLRYLQEYLRKHWEVLRHAQFKHPAFGFLVTLEKALRGVK